MVKKKVVDEPVVLTPQEERAEIARERRERAKERERYRKSKRKDKRSQSY